jgi:flagellar motor switch protein FliN/FliY
MAEMLAFANAMLAAAGDVLGRLVDLPASAGTAIRHDHEGSIHTDRDELVTLAELPSVGARVVVRVRSADMQKIVGIMLGGADEGGSMGPMQLSIASETVSQIAVAMVEALAGELSASTDGIKAELCTDPAALPPPPFESYQGTVSLGGDLTSSIAIDFDGVTRAKFDATHAPEPVAAPVPEPAPAPARVPQAAAATSAQNIEYTTMQPTPVRPAHPGQANLDLVHDVPLQISAVLGKTVMPLREVVALQSGVVFELDKLAAEPIDLYVNNILIARGEVVVVDDKYAVKISELNPTAG